MALEPESLLSLELSALVVEESDDDEDEPADVEADEVDVDFDSVDLSFSVFFEEYWVFYVLDYLSVLIGGFEYEEDDGFVVKDEEVGGDWAGEGLGVDWAGGGVDCVDWVEEVLGFESVSAEFDEVDEEVSYVLKRLLKSILLPLLLPE